MENSRIANDTDIDTKNEHNVTQNQLQPLCLFYISQVGQKTSYHDSTRPRYSKRRIKRETNRNTSFARKRNGKHFTKKPISLASFLLAKGKCKTTHKNENLPPLTTLLEIVQGAWETDNNRMENDNIGRTPNKSTVLERRLSVPEEIMRKYVVSKDIQTEDSENKTVPECTSSSSSTTKDQNVTRGYNSMELNDTLKINDQLKESVSISEIVSKEKNIEIRKKELSKRELLKTDVFSHRVKSEDSFHQSFVVLDEENDSSDSSDSIKLPKMNTIKRAPLRRGSLLLLNDNPIDKQSVTDSVPGETSSSANTGRSQSLSSPAPCTRPLTSSENVSSDSEGIRCNCSDLTSYVSTSTDPYHSGKSTLSQSKSEKTISTQDSTISIKSISTRGSTATAESGTNSTTPDDPHTTNKETSSTESTPRSKWSKKYQHSSNPITRNEKNNSNTCQQNQVPFSKTFTSIGVETDFSYLQSKSLEEEMPKSKIEDKQYKWSTLSKEESNLIQQQNHKRFVESDRQFSTPLPQTSLPSANDAPNLYTINATNYKSKSDAASFIVPRYSALPRSLSMVVNTSKEATTNSDSESLTDSLEDEQRSNYIVTELYDTKNEKKPVRGAALQQQVKKGKPPKGKAYFLVVDKKGDSELMTNIHKIPEPPEKIKKNIFERHTNICKIRKIEERIKKTNDQNLKKSKEKVKNTSKTLRQNATQKLKKKSDKLVKMVDVSVETEETYSYATSNKTPRKSRIPVLMQKEQTLKTEEFHKSKDIPLPKVEQVPIKPSIPIVKKSPKRFQQKFEVIPEERSSSLNSSTEDIVEERSRRRSLPEKTFHSPKLLLQDEWKTFRRFSLGSLPKAMISELIGRSLQTISCVQQGANNEKTEIIIFSPKVPNSAKGRDALLAVNKDDFHRLSKGWMNFYLLKENSENNSPRDPSDDTNIMKIVESVQLQKDKSPDRNQSEISENDTKDTIPTLDHKLSVLKLHSEEEIEAEVKIEEKTPLQNPIRFHSSNVPLNNSKKPLPASQTTSNGKNLLKDNEEIVQNDKKDTNIPKSDSGESQSDSTVYFQPPSPKVPRLPIEECNSLSDYSWSTSDEDEPTNRKVSQLPPRRRPFVRAKNTTQTSMEGKRKGSSGWSVTVEGTLEFRRQTPDVQMRLSFPLDKGPPIISQSDSGFVDDQSKKSVKSKKQWTVTVANPASTGSYSQNEKTTTKSSAILPTIPQARPTGKHSKNVFKLALRSDMEKEMEQKLNTFLPKLQEIVQSQLNEMSITEEINDEPLSVRGKAVVFEKDRPIAVKMSQRDLTRRSTSRMEKSSH